MFRKDSGGKPAGSFVEYCKKCLVFFSAFPTPLAGVCELMVSQLFVLGREIRSLSWCSGWF